MRRALPLIVALAALLVCSPSALAVRAGGHNKITNKLEVSFKYIASYRIRSKDGCYPPAGKAVAIIRKRTKFRARVTGSLGSVRSSDVNVVSGPTKCGRLVLALRNRGKLLILDSLRGPVYVQGTAGESEESRRGGRGPLRDVSLVGRTFSIAKWDQIKRFEVGCPGGTFPLGGGMTTSPPVGPDGEGVYPHSYERLGAQRGFHITVVMSDPSMVSTTARQTTVQATCGRGLVPTASPHKTVFIRRGGTGSAIARCPGGTQLFSGGFQRTNFTTPFLTRGGNYVTESRAIGTRAWRVAGAAVGADAGELTAIALCAKDPSLPLTEVSASTPILGGLVAKATTPPCPAGTRLTSGGFSFNGSRDGLFNEGTINADGTWTAVGFGFFGPVPNMSAFGYCLRA